MPDFLPTLLRSTQSRRNEQHTLSSYRNLYGLRVSSTQCSSRDSIYYCHHQRLSIPFLSMYMTWQSNTKTTLHQHVRWGLPLVPPDRVEDVWLHPVDDLKTSFNDYVTKQWVDREPDRWNHHSTEGLRTTYHLFWRMASQTQQLTQQGLPKLIPNY